MPGFIREVINLRRFFPATGTQPVNPSEIADSVQPVFDYLRPSFAHSVRLFHQVNTLNPTAAGTNQLSLGSGSSDIAPGYFRIPIATGVWHTDGTGRFVEYGLVSDLLAPDFWGTYAGLGSGIQIGQAFVSPPAAGTVRIEMVPIYIPIPRGHQYTFFFREMAAGFTINVRQFAIDVPGELLDVQAFMGRAFSVVQNHGI